MPMSAFMNFEIYPLADMNTVMKATAEALKAAEKCSPPRKWRGSVV
jgi:hypothetical protein